MSWLDDIGGPAMLGPLAVLVLFPLSLLVSSVRGAAPHRGAAHRAGHRDRLDLVSGVAGAVSGCAFGYLILPWGAVPPLIWSACLVATVVGAAVGTTRWPQLPTVAAGRPRLRHLSTALSVGLAVALVVTAVALATRPS